MKGEERAPPREVAERKRAEARFLASEVRYCRLFEAAKDGILILDAETGMIVDVNPFLIELLGFSRDQFSGKRVWELGAFKDIVANQANFVALQQVEYIRYDDKPLETLALGGHDHTLNPQSAIRNLQSSYGPRPDC